jgi:hypothetical protein
LKLLVQQFGAYRPGFGVSIDYSDIDVRFPSRPLLDGGRWTADLIRWVGK